MLSHESLGLCQTKLIQVVKPHLYLNESANLDWLGSRVRSWRSQPQRACSSVAARTTAYVHGS